MKTVETLPITRSIFLVFLICSVFFISCEQDSFFSDSKNLENVDHLKDKDGHLKSGDKIFPSSATDAYTKAQEDWQNIYDALQNAGPGETVQLAEGLFYLHKSLFRWDFNGILRGAGKDKTTVQTVPGYLFDVGDCPDLVWPWGTVEGHFVICFPHHTTSEKRTVTVSDLKIHVTERATQWVNAQGNLVNGLQAVNIHYEKLIIPGDLSLSDKIDLNVNYKNISVVGVEDENGFILNIGLAAFGASSGSFEAKNVDLTNVGNGINPHVFCGENSVVTMKNCRISNTIVGSYTFLVSSYDIKGNEINNVGAIGLQLFSNNPWVTFDMPENVYSAIKDNSIQMNTFNPNDPAILGVRMNHVDVNNNVIRGRCGVGITAWGGFFDTCEDWSIKDNYLCDLVLTHTNLPEGTTIELNNALNCEVKNNANQVVGGASAGDPSNLIGDAVDCPF
jgi:hypothetical protein